MFRADPDVRRVVASVGRLVGHPGCRTGVVAGGARLLPPCLCRIVGCGRGAPGEGPCMTFVGVNNGGALGRRFLLGGVVKSPDPPLSLVV